MGGASDVRKQPSPSGTAYSDAGPRPAKGPTGNRVGAGNINNDPGPMTCVGPAPRAERRSEAEAAARIATWLKLPDGVPPTDKFSPAPGIWVKRTGTSVFITGVMEVEATAKSGVKATPELAKTLEDTINRKWTRNFGGTNFGGPWKIQSTIVVRPQGAEVPPGAATKIVVDRSDTPSNVDKSNNSRVYLNLNDFTSESERVHVIGHKFGNVLGLKDRSEEANVSRSVCHVYDASDPSRYESNLMADGGRGDLEAQNIIDLVTENKPTSSADAANRVRNWIEDANSSDIKALSTDDKVHLVKMLLAGQTVSGSNSDVIRKIWQSATTPEEARAIQDGVGLDLSNSRL